MVIGEYENYTYVYAERSEAAKGVVVHTAQHLAPCLVRRYDVPGREGYIVCHRTATKN